MLAVNALQVYSRTFWTESFVQWSPHGSFLATLHRQGVAIWGGSSFARIHRYSHPGVGLPLNAASMLTAWRTYFHKAGGQRSHLQSDFTCLQYNRVMILEKACSTATASAELQ